ncbi:antitoxin [Halostreptopolyspora alba]|uniref:Antitoxin n=1 Tax=Halostreptopolyspora alba TaxID=2487137 RepID=A0A3N0EI71_9ACTN|nr:antitoxin [Nocardiopsaceae bacterium YIM 96095]
MANLQSLLRQALGYLRRNPDKANRHLHTASDTIKKRTGGRYNRHIDKAISGASRYLTKQSGRSDRGAPEDRDLGHRSGGSAPNHRPDGDDHRRG